MTPSGQRFVRLSLALLMAAAGCARAPRPSTPASVPGVLETREGLASFYGESFNGRLTASGVRFDMHAMVAAHPSYPFGTLLRVTNLANGRVVRVRIVDRGPAPNIAGGGVIIDLSYGAARALGFVRQGRTRVRLDVLRWGA